VYELRPVEKIPDVEVSDTTKDATCTTVSEKNIL